MSTESCLSGLAHPQGRSFLDWLIFSGEDSLASNKAGAFLP
jgi:hypothetical protein